MAEFKVGDKVLHEEFGVGEVVRAFSHADMILVKTDRFHETNWRGSRCVPFPVADQGVATEPSKFEEIALECARMTDAKSKSYGNSTGFAGKVMQLMFPNGIPVDRYDTVLILIRCLDKINRLATNVADDAELDAWRDLLGYSLIGIKNAEDKKAT